MTHYHGWIFQHCPQELVLVGVPAPPPGGPYGIAAGQTALSGAVAGNVAVAGTVAGEVF